MSEIWEASSFATSPVNVLVSVMPAATLNQLHQDFRAMIRLVRRVIVERRAEFALHFHS